MRCIEMAKMTKAQAKKRLDEARKKVDAVAFGDAARYLTSGQRDRLYAISNQLISLMQKMG